MRAVHLRVVELEGHCQPRADELPTPASPYHEGIVEDAAVHPHGTVDIVSRQRRCADDHAVGDVVVLAPPGHLGGEPQIVGVELRKVARERDVARADFSAAVGHDGADGEGVVAHQPVAHGEHVELGDLGGRHADAPAHEHVELQSAPAAEAPQRRHVERAEECHHGHRRLHPHPEGIGARGLFGVYFLYHRFSFLGCKVTAAEAAGIEEKGHSHSEVGI